MFKLIELCLKVVFMPVYMIYKIIVAVLFVGVLSLFFGGCAPAGACEWDINTDEMVCY